MHTTANPRQIYNAIKIFHPDVLEKIKPKLVKPQAALFHTVLLPALLKRFCELQEISQQSMIGKWQGSEAIQAKILFIAVVINLYDPQLLTGIHSQALKTHLAEELSKLLETDRTWISQNSPVIFPLA